MISIEIVSQLSENIGEKDARLKSSFVRITYKNQLKCVGFLHSSNLVLVYNIPVVHFSRKDYKNILVLTESDEEHRVKYISAESSAIGFIYVSSPTQK